ncbi:hypothetical protein [Paenibacillus terrae]|uniref:Uncharacterized protein n=1 Tax=Paenibacillus terrae TaxID=159743 RepID=A0A0D7WXA7_9BACL|nr:hypothetical protein [Paenibacillus terrae]KJD43629.1 hypothetical protein QD47_21370 [Paenibacillus terrae]
MAHKLLKLYKNDLSLFHTLIKKMKWTNFYKSIFTLILSIALIIILKNQIQSSWGNISFVILILWYVVFFRESKRERDRIIQIDNGGKSYYQVRIDGLKKFLRNEGIDTDPQKIDLLIKMVEKHSEEEKVPFFIGRGIILTIIIPIITATYTNILNKYIDRLETVILIFIVLIAIILILFYYVSIFKFFYDEFINGDYQRYKTIANDLRELYFKEV